MAKVTPDLIWHLEERNINDLNPAPYNPRRMTKDQKDQLKQSLNNFGLAEPIIININNIVIGGHQRLKILKQEGIKSVDVSVPSRELSKEEEKELNLRLNKNLGEWDIDLLANNFDLDMLEEIGFTEYELLGDTSEKLTEKTEEINFYQKSHILISIPVDSITDEFLLAINDIKKIDGVEIEQSAN